MEVVVNCDGTETRLHCTNYEEGQQGLALLDENGERSGYVPFENLEYVEATDTSDDGDVDAPDEDAPDEDDLDEDELSGTEA